MKATIALEPLRSLISEHRDIIIGTFFPPATPYLSSGGGRDCCSDTSCLYQTFFGDIRSTHCPFFRKLYFLSDAYLWLFFSCPRPSIWTGKLRGNGW
jgi:hypothetical protein